MGKLLSTYCVSPAGRYFGMSLLSVGGGKMLAAFYRHKVGENPNRAGRKGDPNG